MAAVKQQQHRPNSAVMAATCLVVDDHHYCYVKKSSAPMHSRHVGASPCWIKVVVVEVVMVKTSCGQKEVMPSMAPLDLAAEEVGVHLLLSFALQQKRHSDVVLHWVE